MEIPKTTSASPKSSSTDYAQIANSPAFKKLLTAKKKFIIPFTLFFFCFYFALPIMTSYTKVLNEPFIGSITWAWVFAFLQFVMTWSFCMIYSSKAKKFDELTEDILKERGR